MPLAEPKECYRTGFNISEIREYGISRYSSVDPEDRTNVVDDLANKLRTDGNQVVVGKPGTGKKTLCRAVANQWYNQAHGEVFYRRANVIPQLDKPSIVADRLRAVSGHTLIVVENVIGNSTRGAFQLAEKFRDCSDVSLLFEAREREWDKRADYLNTARIKQLAESKTNTYLIPDLDSEERERIADQYIAYSDLNFSPPKTAGLLDKMSEATKKPTDSEEGGSVDITNLSYLTHSLSAYLQNVKTDAQKSTNITSSLSNDVEQAYRVFTDSNDDTFDLSIICNLLNVANAGIHKEFLYPLSEDNDGYREIDQSIRDVSGTILFDSADADGFRTVSQHWSLLYLHHAIEKRSASELRQIYLTWLSNFSRFVEDNERREELEEYIGSSIPKGSGREASLFERVIIALFSSFVRYPSLCELAGRHDDKTISQLLDGIPEIDAQVSIYRCGAYRRAENYDLAAREASHALETARGLESTENASEWIASALGNLNRVVLAEDESVEPEELLKSDSSDSRYLIIDELINRGQALEENGSPLPAFKNYTLALNVSKEINYELKIAHSYTNLGNNSMGKESPDQDLPSQEFDRKKKELADAKKWYNLARNAAEQAGDTILHTRVIHNVGTLLFNQYMLSASQQSPASKREYLKEAQERCTYAHNLSREYNYQTGVTKALNTLGQVAHEYGNFQQAESLYKRARDTAESPHNLETRAIAHFQLAKLYLDFVPNSSDRAVRNLNKSIDIFETTNQGVLREMAHQLRHQIERDNTTR